MTAGKKKVAASPADRRLFIGSLIFFLVSCLMVGLAIVSQRQGNSATTNNTVSSGQSMPLEPQVVINLTSLPQSPPLNGDLADQIKQIEQMVENCPAYSKERREQMQQHITWLLNPAQIPRQLIIALGSNPNGKLILGMATYTLSDWGLQNRPADSCLLTIGRKLNELLKATGETPIPEFGT
jgi:hypothetical protein